MAIEKWEILDKLERKYGDLDGNTGCYINGEWLSLNEILKIIESCNDY